MKKVHQPHDELTVHVKGRNLTVTPALHDQVVRKLSKLEKYHDRLHDIDVELLTEPTRDAAHRNCVEATTRVLGQTIRVSSTDVDMFAAIDAVVDKLYRHLNRQKERIKSHHGTKLAETLPTESFVEPENGSPGVDAGADVGPVVRVERLDMKPLFEDEAIEEMETGGRQFYVFLNGRTEQVNVLYRHEDGGYGLIEPHVRSKN